MQPFLFLLNLKFKNFMKLLIKTSQKISPDFEKKGYLTLNVPEILSDSQLV